MSEEITTRGLFEFPAKIPNLFKFLKKSTPQANIKIPRRSQPAPPMTRLPSPGVASGARDRRAFWSLRHGPNVRRLEYSACDRDASDTGRSRDFGSWDRVLSDPDSDGWGWTWTCAALRHHHDLSLLQDSGKAYPTAPVLRLESCLTRWPPRPHRRSLLGLWCSEMCTHVVFS